MSKELSAYLPAIIRSHLDEIGDVRSLPLSREIDTAVLFCDIAGFTALSESLASEGHTGAESLAKALNSYFGTMVRLISRGGGDVLKFAGDAVIVLWPPNGEPSHVLVRRAMQCALDIQEHLSEANVDKVGGVRHSPQP
jgi:adenylate cyclase 10